MEIVKKQAAKRGWLIGRKRKIFWMGVSHSTNRCINGLSGKVMSTLSSPMQLCQSPAWITRLTMSRLISMAETLPPGLSIPFNTKRNFKMFFFEKWVLSDGEVAQGHRDQANAHLP